MELINIDFEIFETGEGKAKLGFCQLRYDELITTHSTSDDMSCICQCYSPDLSQVAHLNHPIALLSVAVMFVCVVSGRLDVLARGGRLNGATAVGCNDENRCIRSLGVIR